jgi:hypothetical protein
MADDKKDDDDVPRIGKDEATQRLEDMNRPPTHFAMPAKVVQDVIGFLENKPWKCTVKQAVELLHGINTGTPLVLGPKTNQ